MAAGIISPVTSVVEAGSQAQQKLQEMLPVGGAQKEPRADGADYLRLSQTRLVIEPDSENGGWVYKTVDVNNGQLLAEYPLRSAWQIILSRRSGLGLVVDAKA